MLELQTTTIINKQ